MYNPAHSHRGLVAAIATAAVLAAACAQPTPAPRTLPSPATGFAASQPRFDFKTLEVPGAKRTIAWGIDDAGEIVGAYDDSAGTHGFLLRNDRFTTLNFPGAGWTAAFGIGLHGEIVGAYKMPSEPAVNFHGFLRSSDGRFERVESPPYKNTIAQRILPDGTILGCRHGDDFGASMRGAVLGAQNHSETQAFGSMHNGATPDLRRIVGLYNYAPGDRSAGYVIDDGKFKPLVVPGSSATSAWDVNPAGDVVGTYRDSLGVHGFMLATGGFIPLNVPTATNTRALGINSDGAVVGSFEAGGRTHGFVATPASRLPRYERPRSDQGHDSVPGTKTMQIKRSGSQPSGKGPAEWFTGTVRIDPLFPVTAPARAAGNAVTFEPGARTAWHTHPLGQILIVTFGLGWVQRDGGPIEEIRPGDVAWFEPGEKHWHGASPTTAMTHIAIQESLDGKAVDWMEKVSDEQYRRR